MKITKEKVQAFFEDRCSGEEAEMIYRFLLENLQVLEAYFPEEEWKSFITGDELPGHMSAAWLERIREERHPVRRLRTRLRQVLGAAALLLGAALACWIWRSQTPVQKAIPLGQAAGVRDSLLVNRSKSVTTARLSDGSLVALSPNSEIRLRWNFETHTRRLELKGEALFRVHHDSTRPFTVYSGGFSTTALGTVFRVRAFPGREAAGVRLIQGRVVVRNLVHPGEQEFLVAGQSCTFDTRRGALRKEEAPAAPVKAPDIGTLRDNSAVETDARIEFKNLPLARVFNLLGRAYRTPVLFNPIELAHRKYTGMADKTQPLQSALITIAQLNDLQVISENGGFRITTAN